MRVVKKEDVAGNFRPLQRIDLPTTPLYLRKKDLYWNHVFEYNQDLHSRADSTPSSLWIRSHDHKAHHRSDY